MRFYITSLLVLFAFVSNVLAQDQYDTQERFVYGIENVSSLEQINTLERYVLALDFIGQVKIEYKTDKGIARMEFTVVQVFSEYEGRKNIDLAEIKKLIIAGGMTPVECVKVN